MTGPTATANIFATYLPDHMTLWRGFLDEVSGLALTGGQCRPGREETGSGRAGRPGEEESGARPLRGSGSVWGPGEVA